MDERTRNDTSPSLCGSEPFLQLSAYLQKNCHHRQKHKHDNTRNHPAPASRCVCSFIVNWVENKKHGTKHQRTRHWILKERIYNQPGHRATKRVHSHACCCCKKFCLRQTQLQASRKWQCDLIGSQLAPRNAPA